jgi:hypothetical protein
LCEVMVVGRFASSRNCLSCSFYCNEKVERAFRFSCKRGRFLSLFFALLFRLGGVGGEGLFQMSSGSVAFVEKKSVA